MTTCKKCGEPRIPGKNCAACNRRRVYAWIDKNRDKWNALQVRSRRKRQRLPPPRPDFVCVQCGKSLEGRHHSTLYCSYACHAAYKRRLRIVEPRECALCGASITHMRPHALYCSPRCAVIAGRARRYQERKRSA